MPVLEALETKGVTGGTNCNMSFQSSNGSFAIAVRVRKLAHKWEVIATESHARINRAMYPHQRAVGQFALTLDMKGYAEFSLFMDFMMSYVRVENKPPMLVVMSVRNFSRKGIPIKGMSMGDHVGSNLIQPTILFESAHDPLDTTIVAPSDASSSAQGGKAEKDARNFFYPFSPGSEDPNVKAETIYDFSGYNQTVMPPGPVPPTSLPIGDANRSTPNTDTNAIPFLGNVSPVG
jgi:hypothetical protein